MKSPPHSPRFSASLFLSSPMGFENGLRLARCRSSPPPSANATRRSFGPTSSARRGSSTHPASSAAPSPSEARAPQRHPPPPPGQSQHLERTPPCVSRPPTSTGRQGKSGGGGVWSRRRLSSIAIRRERLRMEGCGRALTAAVGSSRLSLVISRQWSALGPTQAARGKNAPSREEGRRHARSNTRR